MGVRTSFYILSILLPVIFLLTAEYITRLFTLPLNPNILNGNVYSHDPKLGMLYWSDNIKTHPYFGFIREPNEKLIYEIESATSKQFVVLILGGSVAENFGNDESMSIKSELQQRIFPLNEREIKIFNLATGAYKQPQQFFIFSYLVDHVDLVINIDGFNEINYVIDSFYFPLKYPRFMIKYFSDFRGNWFIRSLAKISKFVYATGNHLPTFFPWLSSSRLYYYSWIRLRPRLLDFFLFLENKYEKSLFGNLQPFDHSNSAHKLSKKIKIWRTYTSLMSSLAKSKNIYLFSFIQPNQYLPNSKLLNKEELRYSFLKKSTDSLAYALQALQKAALAERSTGSNVYDLTQIFKNEVQTIYIDTCCHINALGNKIMSKSILETIELHINKNPMN